MKPWREIAVPHPDVLAGTFQQSEFAADISAVRAGKAPPVYQDARTFFERTFITEGMRLLLTQVAERLNGRGGEPVVQLQTAFGGGKTHTLLAVWHLATRECALGDLPGVPALLERAGLMDLPRARAAVLDGTAHSPGQPWKHGKHEIHTLWGELAWQLGGAEAFELVREADATGTSPGKERLARILASAAPCVVLVDELVTYVRQFPDGRALSGGTYDSNLSFLQALTEAVKLVPNAILLASLPESDVEAGGSTGVGALRAVEKLFGRVQALWKPVAIEESFEIVRRRLFEPIRDEAARDAVCAAFAALYRDEGAKVPSETHDARYHERLRRAYPIHPEVFDRLYEDWTTLDGFQRTRGVLKLMAKVIFRLWKDENRDLMLLPGSLPLYDGGARNELTYHLGPGWDPVLDRDVDGERAEAREIDTRDTRFGAVQAARRVSRTLFLGSAPSAVSPRAGTTRGIERGRILLGCLQPGQSSATYADALSRIADRAHYLNASGDKAQDGTRFWFDVRANLRREMEDRKGRFDERTEVRGRVAEAVAKLTGGRGTFDGVHVFTPHADVPDDGALRLVVLPPDRAYSRQEADGPAALAREYVLHNGTRPRFKANRLVFLAADAAGTGRLRDAVRTALAWASIVGDIATGRLVIDRLQENQAKKESETADAVVLRAARECYRWVLCPVLASPTETVAQVEAFPLNTSGAGFADELARVCEENELVIPTWSPIHLRTRLRELYWKEGAVAVRALQVWDDMTRYLYLPRLRGRATFEAAVRAGAGSIDFFGTAYGQDGERYDGLRLGDAGVQVDDTLLLVEPGAAATALERQRAAVKSPEPKVEPDPVVPIGTVGPGGGGGVAPVGRVATGPASFFGSIELPASTVGIRMVMIDEEVVRVLLQDPNAVVKVSVEISAEFPNGVSENVKRAVSENAATLGFKSPTWE